MDEQGLKLRAAIEKDRGGQTRWRCSRSLRSEVVVYARSRRESGAPTGEIARDLGLSESGLKRWLDVKQSESFRPVRVGGRGELATGLVVVTPRGYRVEGLSVHGAAELLSKL